MRPATLDTEADTGLTGCTTPAMLEVPGTMVAMALRSPTYLDVETLLSHAEYFDIHVPQQAEIVEKTVRKRSGGGKAGLSGLGLDASVGIDIEFQSTYTLAPRQKAIVSKVIDSLITEDAIKVNPGEHTSLSKDDLVEVEGCTRITSASLAGKMFFILRRVMADAQGDLDAMLDLDADDPQVLEQLKRVYLQNELLPIPMLLEMSGSSLPQRVYINVRSDHFIDAASANRVEGEIRVLGTISRLVPGGEDGFLSAEDWLLHDWEYLMRRLAMTRIDQVVKELFDQLDLGLPADDLHAYITGPAVVIDAIALY